MLYRIDPKSGAELSALGFGCMRLPRRGIAVDMKASERLITRAIESGVNFFDTAYIYPGSEAAFGEIIHKNNLRGEIYISTKLPHYQCGTYADFDRIFDTQKARLKTGCIDYYFVHNMTEPREWRRLAGLGFERWVKEKKESGEIKAFGFSFHGTQANFLGLLDEYDWDVCMIQYNYINEHYQAGRLGLEKARAKGLSVIVMEPLLGGKLATGLPKKAEKLLADADPSRTPAMWSLLWLWNQPEVTVVLSGMNRDEHLTDNLCAAGSSHVGAASETDLAAIESVRRVFEESYKVPCTGCNYCMPCPKNVNIPGSFSAYNALYATGFISGMTQYVTSTNSMRGADNYMASNCDKCGICESKCPQHIKIAAALEKAKKRLEPFWLNAILKIGRKIIRSNTKS